MWENFYYNVRYAGTLRKPRLLRRLAHNVIRSAIFQKTPMRYVDICVSTKCNLSCEHCFATVFERPGEDILSLDEWEDIAAQCMRLGCASFGITGGEPLMYENLPALIERLAPERNLITVNTNGTLLTNSLARRLYQAGVDVLQFSMDSAIPEEHDKFRRGKGAYRALQEAIDIAETNRLKVTLVGTVSHLNARSEGFRALVDYAGRRGFLLIISRAAPAGRWRGNLDILLTEDDRKYIYDLVRQHAHVRTDMDSNYSRYGCSAATEKIYFTPCGDVIPCPFMHICFGNVRQDTVAQIRRRMLGLSCMNSYAPQCLVAEDRRFITDILSRTFNADGLVDWTECFEQSPSVDTGPEDRQPPAEKDKVDLLKCSTS